MCLRNALTAAEPFEFNLIPGWPDVKNVFLIAKFELVRLLSTRRGLVSIVAFAMVWLVLLYYVIFRASRVLAQDGGSGLVSAVLDWLGMERLTAWAVPELAVYWFFGLMLLPLFCISLTADQTASDRSRGTLRYLVLRSTRWQIFFGRYLGQLLVLLLFILISIVTTLPVVLYRDAGGLPDWLALMPAILVNLMIVLLPYTALMALVSVLAKSARQATLYAIILWIAVWFISGLLMNYFPGLSFLDWVMPSSQIPLLLRSVGWDALQFAHIPILQSLLLLVAGWWLMQRRDL